MVDFTDNDELIQAELPSTATPTKVTSVAVVAIILAGLYLLGAIGGAASLGIQVFVPQLLEPKFETDNPQFKIQADFQAKVNANSKQFFWPFVVQTVVYLVLGGMMLIRAVKALRRDDAWHYQLLGQILLWAIGVELLGAILVSIFQYGQWQAMQGLSLPEGAGGQARYFKSILLYSTLFGIVMAWLWHIGKLVFLALGATVVRKHAAALSQSKP